MVNQSFKLYSKIVPLLPLPFPIVQPDILWTTKPVCMIAMTFTHCIMLWYCCMHLDLITMLNSWKFVSCVDVLNIIHCYICDWVYISIEWTMQNPHEHLKHYKLSRLRWIKRNTSTKQLDFLDSSWQGCSLNFSWDSFIVWWDVDYIEYLSIFFIFSWLLEFTYIKLLFFRSLVCILSTCASLIFRFLSKGRVHHWCAFVPLLLLFIIPLPVLTFVLDNHCSLYIT